MDISERKPELIEKNEILKKMELGYTMPEELANHRAVVAGVDQLKKSNAHTEDLTFF